MAIEAIFDIGVDQIELRTKTNGDHIEIGPHNAAQLHLGQEAATNLANLINSGQTLTVEIKAKEV